MTKKYLTGEERKVAIANSEAISQSRSLESRMIKAYNRLRTYPYDLDHARALLVVDTAHGNFKGWAELSNNESKINVNNTDAS